MKFTVKVGLELFTSLKKLAETPCTDFDTAKKVARNLRSLNKAIEGWDQVRNTIVDTHTAAETDPRADLEREAAKEVECEIAPLNEADIRNLKPYNPQALAVLDPIIEWAKA